MLPATGWVGDEVVQSDPITLPLPVIYTARYADGDDGAVSNASGASWQANWRFVDCGVRLVEGYSPPGAIPTLTIDLVQPNVFGVLLFDWFTPPVEDYAKHFIPQVAVVDPNADQDSAVAAPVHTAASGGSTPSFSSGNGGATTPTFGVG